jgi:hypothetical protein
MIDRLRAQIMQKESGGRRYDKSGKLLTSSKGAEGEMQVMPYTARDPGFGIRPARDGSPDELRRVGDEYAAAMYNRYGDPKLAMIAYNMGPGATDKWLASGADVRKLPKETQGYIRGVSLAEGGEVKHFQYGGSTMGGFDDAYTDTGVPVIRPEIDEYTIDPMTGQKSFSGYKRKPSAKPSNETFVDPNITALQKRKVYDKPADKEPAQNVPTAKKEEKLTPEQELFNEIRADIKARREAVAEGKKMDKWRAGLAAGAAMMENTSPYAMVGFGSGARAGSQSLAESSKLRAAEEAGIASGMGSLYKNQLISKLRDAQISDTKSYRDSQLNDARIRATENAVDRALKLPANQQQQNLLNAYEMQFSQGKLDQAKIPELERLRAWRAKLENDIRNRMMASGGGTSGGFEGFSARRVGA